MKAAVEAALLALVAGLIGMAWGTQLTADTLANDCVKLGTFRVGDRVFECKERP